MRLADIKIGKRHRKDMGDIDKLIASIEEVGLLQPIVVTPTGDLVAGLRRIKAYEQLGWKEIPVYVLDLDDLVRGEADENVIRKDFTPSEAVAIGRALEPQERQKSKEAQQRAGQEFGRGQIASEKFPEAIDDRALGRVAKMVGMSRPTYTKARVVVEAAEENQEEFGDLVEKMDASGKVSPIYHELRVRIKAKEAAKDRDAQAVKVALEKTYNVIVADPPWQYQTSIQKWGPANLHYPTMPIEDICQALEMLKLEVAENAALFLWATNPLLKQALRVVESWGFEYKTNICWVKTELKRPGSGWYVRGRHELCLIATRGSFTPLNLRISPPIGSVIESPVREHSRKPDRLYEIIETLYPECIYAELFARHERPGWESFGLETGLWATTD